MFEAPISCRASVALRHFQFQPELSKKPRDKTIELNCLMKLCPNSILNKRTHFESLWCNMQPGSASRSASSAFMNMLFKVWTKQAWLIEATPQKSWMIRYINTWYHLWFMTMHIHMFILQDYLIPALLKCRPIVWYIGIYITTVVLFCTYVRMPAHAMACRISSSGDLDSQWNMMCTTAFQQKKLSCRWLFVS